MNVTSERNKVDDILISTYNRLSNQIDSNALSLVNVLMRWSYERGILDHMTTVERISKILNEEKEDGN